MRVVVTCGPSFEPIDRVRRITNFSTGELGTLLANALARAGHEVVCCRGVSATCAIPLVDVETITFTTNDDLLEALRAQRGSDVGAVFHVAALADFRVKKIVGAEGEAKFSSRAGEITITLAPATKLIGELRPIFPAAKIVGWKYELDGTRDEAIAKARAQLVTNASDACVVNGAAYGDGFGFCVGSAEPEHFASKEQLCDALMRWLGAA